VRRHLIDLATIGRDGVVELIERARRLRSLAFADRCGRLVGREVVHLFLEPSTRTRVSFEIAARRLGATVIALDAELSSLLKGESLEDTVRTVEAMGTDALVVRHERAGTAAALAGIARGSVINAGDGNGAHPTQGLLDLLTLLDEFGTLAGRRIAIVGDVRHSRVARSDVEAFSACGAEVILVSPPALRLDPPPVGARTAARLEPLLPSLDAVVLLRIQRERFGPGFDLDHEEYVRDYRFTEDRLAATPEHCVVLHPGPVNRGVEVTDAVADGPRSRILRQVENGVAVRMAVLEWLLAE
jgi:aspartate carbamoyltransferase catalytic subunit